MNEVTRIHLGRQPFTISVAAHKELKVYLASIKQQVGDQDVVDEVELRMAELLAEHGISGEKVILEEDVTFLKQQLGDPKDFTEEAKETPTATEPQNSKQLFRDVDNGIVAGVAAGLGAYFGVDAVLFRVLFIITIFTGGLGVLLYIVLWLLVPPAQSSSDKLRMQGKSVTLENLKQAVERADAKGVAQRTGRTLAPVINSVFRFVFKLIGIGFIAGGLAALFGIVVLKTYMLLHHGQLFEENLFPVGRAEHILADLGLVLGGILAIFSILCGLAVFKRRWPVRGWVTGVIAGLFMIGFAGAVALTADTAPNVRDRYLSQSHTVTRSVDPFQDVTITGKDVDYRWEYADTYSVSFHYFDNPDISKIKTTVSNNLLTIDTSNYERDRHCNMICIFPAYNLLVTVKGPKPISDKYTIGQPVPPVISQPFVR